MSSIVEETPLVPVIKKSEFDDVATEFLTEYCPDALETPMAVPIMKIARKKLGLIVCTKYRLSEDFSNLGQMCFNSGYVEVYVKETDEFIKLTVRRGTIFIDPDVVELRNQGCFNNTVAHECVHWYKHRNYHLLAHVNDIKQAKKHRCPAEKPDENIQDKWTDENWMEWQANGIAPRILMPKKMFIQAADDLREELSDIDNSYVLGYTLKNKLAELFDVSKQSAGIRMQELGIL